MKTLKVIFAALTLLSAAPAMSWAEDISIGMPIEPVMDPHYFWSAKYGQYYRHYLGYLVTLSADVKVTPELAESWESTETGWTFHLRPGQKFSDGSTFDAADVVASFDRARNYEGAAGSYAGLFSQVSDIIAVDENTVQLNTSSPYPALGFALTQVPVIPSEIAESAEQADFNTVKGSVSIGPYRFVSYSVGQQMELERNPDYWGEPARFDHVTLRVLPDNSARMAALLAGDVDVVGGVPPEFVSRIKEDDQAVVHTGPSLRTMFMSLDFSNPDKTAYANDNNGQPLNTNPFMDKRVREALSLAIDRMAIQSNVMDGLSFPTGQLVTKGVGGYSEDIGVPEYNVEKAKALLAEAGYPEGFQTAVFCTNDRYVNDGRICQALGQMFARIGIKAQVNAIPSSAFFKVLGEHGAPLFYLGWSPEGSGEADVLAQMLQTKDPDKKTGAYNFSGYSNPELDALISEYQTVIDNTERWALEVKAMKLALDDYAILPMHDQSVIVATRKGLDYAVSPDEMTTAMLVR